MKRVIILAAVLLTAMQTVNAQSATERTTIKYNDGSSSTTTSYDNGSTQNTHIENDGSRATGVGGTDKHKSFVRDAVKARRAGGSEPSSGSRTTIGSKGSRSRSINVKDYNSSGKASRR